MKHLLSSLDFMFWVSGLLVWQDKNEHHFSRVKEGSKGCLNLKAALFSTQRAHWLQKREGQPKANKTPKEWNGLDHENSTRIAKAAFQASMLFASVFQIGKSSQKIGEELRAWYQQFGGKLLFQFQETDSESSSEEDCEDEGWLLCKSKSFQNIPKPCFVFLFLCSWFPFVFAFV